LKRKLNSLSYEPRQTFILKVMVSRSRTGNGPQCEVYPTLALQRENISNIWNVATPLLLS